MAEDISFTLNGKSVSVTTEGDRRLLWVLRADLGLTGTKYSCGKAYCGACTVLVDGRAVLSCQERISRVHGKEVTTIEGLAANGNLHPLQSAFMKHDALQCGFCTPGMILTACDFLTKNPQPTREQIIDGMEGNLCRCGAHTRIIDAIQDVVQQTQGS
jgi:aerobic-type carbon monoxide dehydrogenase small subunit (CoxS/CutS family)